MAAPVRLAAAPSRKKPPLVSIWRRLVRRMSEARDGSGFSNRKEVPQCA
jgi:hypothetical protein